MIKPLFILSTLAMIACKNTSSDSNASSIIENQSTITELTDEQYPDNNDIESRSPSWNKYSHDKVEVIRNSEKDFTVVFYPNNELSDTLFIDHVNLLAWMPTIPDYITDDYLKHIGIINAEWNRNQVKLVDGEFRMSTGNEEHSKTVRVDLARNCLNAYAWEVITYADEGSMYHGWFDFPKALYRELFDEVNEGKVTFAEYKDHLEIYNHPRKEIVDLNILRDVKASFEVPFTNLNDQGYPMTGARKSKYKNIVSPHQPAVINDFLNDETKFSTFQWPGWYDTKDPRTSTLSMLAHPAKVVLNGIVSNNKTHDETIEFNISFARADDSSYISRVVVGGVKISDLKQMPVEDYNGAFKYPMGIGNHPFYESLTSVQTNLTQDSPYYAFILDPEGKWVDSHFFGVDGPLIHLDENNPNLIHFWLLSFERHAMVTHLTFEIPKPKPIGETTL